MKIKNVSPGPRGLNAKDGHIVVLQAGEEADVDLSDAEVKSAKAGGQFEFEDKKGK
jgi:hypothetical protein